MSKNPRRLLSPQLIAGLVLISLGILFLLDELRLIYVDFGDLWPLIPIVIGLANLFSSDLRKRKSGAWLTMFGFWLAISEWELFGLDWSTSWPLIIIGVGLLIIWQSLVDPTGRRTGRDDA